jgi:hypothetical protein
MTEPSADRPERSGPAALDSFIPVRNSELLAALLELGPIAIADRPAVRRIGRMLAAICHYEYFDRLETLRDRYFYFSPDRDPHAGLDRAAIERAYADLMATLETVVKDANFVELTHQEVDAAHRAHKVLRVAVRTPTDDFREIRIFCRGSRHERHQVADWFGLRRRQVEVEIHDDVVLVVAMKTAQGIGSARELRLLAQRQIRPGSVLVKYFRNVARQDLNALFPNVRVVLSLTDKLMLAVPALLGGVPILLHLATSATVLLLVVGFYLGLVGAIEQDALKTALAGLSALGALGGFVLQQWMKYQRQALKYQQRLSDNVYYRNLTNNAGVFDAIVGAAEDQEYKEALLGYGFLYGAAMTAAELQQRIEAWLSGQFGQAIAFRVDEALNQLAQLGLVTRDGERLRALLPDQAVSRLGQAWSAALVEPPAD